MNRAPAARATHERSPRLPRPLRAVLGVLAAGAALVSGVAPAESTPAPAVKPSAPIPAPAPAAPAETTRVRLTEVGPAALTPDSRLVVRGTVTTSRSADDLRARLILHEGRLDNRAEVAAWSQAALPAPPAGAGSDSKAAAARERLAGDLLDATRKVAELPITSAGGVLTFAFTIDADELRLPERRTAFGPRGLAVEIIDVGESTEDDAAPVARASTFAVWTPRPNPVDTPTSLSLLVPIMGKASTEAGTPDEAIAADIAPGGRLDQLLNGTDGPGVGRVVDPAVVTAVARAAGLMPSLARTPGSSPSPSPTTSATTTPNPSPGAGTAAPSDETRDRARAWIDALGETGRARGVAWLPWGDPDVAAVAAARSPALLTLADGRARTVVDEALDGKADLSLGWLADGPATQPALDLLASTHRTHVVVRGPRVADDETTDSAPVPVRARAGTVTALVADPALSDAFAGSGEASTSATATQALLADLAALTLEDHDNARRVLAVAPRAWSPSAAALRRTVGVLGSVPWVQLSAPSTLTRAAADAGDTPVTTIDRVSDSRGRARLDAGHVRAVGTTIARLRLFAGAMREPVRLLVPAVEQALSLVSTSWRSAPLAGLTQSRTGLIGFADRLFAGVSVIEGGPYNVVTSKGDLPLHVRNLTPYDLVVTLQIQPLSGQIETPKPVTVNLPANSPQLLVRVPVEAVANGDMWISAQVADRSGHALSAKMSLKLRIRRNWESVGLITLSTILGLMLIVGLARTVHRGRHRIRPEDVPDIDDLAVDEEERARRGAHVALDSPPDAARAALPDAPPDAAPDAPDASTSAVAAPQDGDERSKAAVLARSSAVMAAGTLMSRLLGFVRVAVLAVAIGQAGASADAFSVANKIPNIVYMLVAGGVLNAVLVPQITRAARMGREGKIYVDRLLTAAISMLAMVAVLVTIAAPLLVRLYSGGHVPGSQVSLSAVFAFWCLPQVFFYGLYTVWGQVLNARGQFGAYMWAPVVNNVVAIAGLAAFIAVEGSTGAMNVRPATGWGARPVVLLAGTATLGVIAQALVLWPVLHRSGFRWRPRWGWRGVGLGTASRIAGWTFAAVVVSQLGYIVTSKVLTTSGRLASLDHPGAARSGSALYDSAFLLFMLPHSLVAVSLVTALFTRLSHSAQAGDTDAVRADLSLGLRTVATASVAATAGMISLAPIAVRFLGWNPGVAYGAMAMSVGLVAFSASYLQQRVFYAYEDARTPFFITLPAVGVTVTGSLLSQWLLDPQWVLVGVGLGMSTANFVSCGLLARRLSTQLNGQDGVRVLGVHARLAAAGAVAAGCAWVTVTGVLRGFGVDHMSAAGRSVSGPALMAGVIVFLGVYVGAARALRVRELDLLVAPLLRRLRRHG